MNLKVLFFIIAEHASTRALDALTTLVLIRSLNVTSLGTFMVYQSWVAILLLFFPALENMLYREHGKHRLEGTLARELAVFGKFNTIKIAAAALLVALCSVIPATQVPWPTRLAAVALAFALPLSQALYGIYRETLRFELKQGAVVAINALQRIAVMGAIFLMGGISGGDLLKIAPVALALYFGFGFIWRQTTFKLLSHLPSVKMSFAQTLPRIRAALSQAVIWIHVNGVILGAIQTLDVYFLAQARTPVAEIAIYSIALKAANFFQLISLPFMQAFGVYLGRSSGGERSAQVVNRERRLVWTATGLFVILAGVMVVAGFAFAKPILLFLAKGKFSPEALSRSIEYFRWMIAGVAALSISCAQGSYLSSRGDVKRLSFWVYLPWLGLATAGYALSARLGPLAAARFNLPVGCAYTLGVVLYFSFMTIRLKKR